MNQAHWHLALNHIPIVGVIIGTFILYIGLFRKNLDVQKVALWLFAAVAVVAIPALLTGEGAEEIVEDIAGIQKSIIENHEEVATITFWILILNGVLSLLWLYLQKIKPPSVKIVMYLIIVTAAASCIFSILAANSGGNIRHTEFGDKVVSKFSNVMYFLKNS